MKPSRAHLEAERTAWRRIVAKIRCAPLTDAQRFADDVRAELDREFPERKEWH